MYIKFNDKEVSVGQLKQIAEILNVPFEELTWFYNIYYETCSYEIECYLENNMESKDFEDFKQSEDYEKIMEHLIDELYYSTDYQWDCLYEKAGEIISNNRII